MSKFTAAEMLRRDNFRKRWEDGDAVYLHEFLYALMQGYDAFALNCDVQVGGTEQLFNLMAGRKIQEDAGQRAHVPITMPILVGLDGKERMSKSKGNHIGVSDSPEEQFGKAMSIPDEAVENFFTLATNLHPDDVRAVMRDLRAGNQTPMEVKKLLARTIVGELWGDDAAKNAQAHFERTVQRKEIPDDMPEHVMVPGQLLIDIVVAAGAAPSKREARRLFEQRAVTMDGNVVEPTTPGRAGTVVQVGKRRWLRLVAKAR
jgi:tyrosyl-tRNA synthetase